MLNSNQNRIKLALLDDHQIVIDGLKLLLKNDDRFEVVVECTNSVRFIKELHENDVDIIITDLILPKQMSGSAVAELVKSQFPHIRILALTMNEDAKVVHHLIKEVKVEGFLSKSAGRDELLLALSSISNGSSYYSKEALGLIKYYARIEEERNRLQLSGREMEIVNCMEKRLSNKQIADTLFISERTVETHRKNIYRKTGTKGEAALIDFLKNNGILNGNL